MEKHQTLLPKEVLKASQANVKIWLKSYLESDQQLTENILKIKEKDKHISNLQGLYDSIVHQNVRSKFWILEQERTYQSNFPQVLYQD